MMSICLKFLMSIDPLDIVHIQQEDFVMQIIRKNLLLMWLFKLTMNFMKFSIARRRSWNIFRFINGVAHL